MIRKTLLAMAFTLIATPLLCAETYAEKVKGVDAVKKTITFPVDGKDKSFKVADKVDVQTQVRVGKRLRITPLKEGLKGLKSGMEATITTEKRDGEELVTKIVVLVAEKK